MSVAEPNPDDDVLAAMEAQLDDLEVPEDIENVQKIPSPELTMRVQHIDSKLSSMGELRQPRTQEGRDLHSTRAALLVELARRNMR